MSGVEVPALERRAKDVMLTGHLAADSLQYGFFNTWAPVISGDIPFLLKAMCQAQLKT